MNALEAKISLKINPEKKKTFGTHTLIHCQTSHSFGDFSLDSFGDITSIDNWNI